MRVGAEERRKAILESLRAADKPLSASRLATRFHVSRQIIVGDVALLRAGGADISATPRGYVVRQPAPGLLRQVVCRHGADEIGVELDAVVDQGCTVLDVIVEHPLYGQLTGALQIASRYDVGQFLKRCSRTDAHPLSDLTGGIHLHTLSCPDEAAYERVRQSLRDLRILLEN